MAFNEFLVEDLVAQINAFIADVDPWSCDQLAHLFLGLAAERALQVGIEFGHRLLRGASISRIGRKSLSVTPH